CDHSTAARLPVRSPSRLIFDASVTSKLPPSTNVMDVKSTCSWRESVLVVEPHSISTVPLATIVSRFSGVTFTHLTASSRNPSSCWRALAMRTQRSTEYPAGLPSVSRKENGREASRWPIVIVRVVLILSSVLCGSAPSAGPISTVSAASTTVIEQCTAFMDTVLFLLRSLAFDDHHYIRSRTGQAS